MSPQGLSMPMAFGGMRIGLLGGSFNPPHDGHLHISLLALKKLGLDRIWWLVSPQNPLKSKAPPLGNRLAAAKRVARHPRITVTGIEARLGTTYSADTLRALKSHYRDVHFVWLMGADNLAQIHLWRNWEDIFQSLPIAVFDRTGSSQSPLHSRAAIRFAPARIDESDAKGLAVMPAPAWLFVHARRAPQSSSKLRRSMPPEQGRQFNMG